MSSSSSYSSSSPPSSPQCKHSESILKTLKIKPQLIEKTDEWDEPKAANISDSSKESLNNDYVPTTSSSETSNGDVGLSENKINEDIEATYMTSVSKNLITLRKTESLKLDSVQSIR